MSFEDWKKGNEFAGFDAWQQENAILTATDDTPAEQQDAASQIYDFSQETGATLPESERAYYNIKNLDTGKRPGRFINGLYNATVANTINAITTKSEMGKIGAHIAMIGMLESDFRNRAESGLPVTQQEIDYYTLAYQKPKTFFGVGKAGAFTEKNFPEWAAKIRQDYEAGKIPIMPKRTPEEEGERFSQIYQTAEAKHFYDVDISAQLPEAVGWWEKTKDAVAGIIGFTAQVVFLKRLMPGMPQAGIWELVNEANGGTPGKGAAMQLTLAGISRAMPGTGVIPAAGRGTAASAIFGTTTYLGGGDTTDILINMGIPFAFEGMGLTKQKWANYGAKKELIDALKMKAPALKETDNILIDKAIGDLLTNVTTIGAKELMTKEQMQKGFAPTERQPDISAEMKEFLQRKRYDELLQKASEGDKKATKELNDYVQGTNLPTYEQLLEKGYAGDQSAFEQIQAGNYFKGEKPQPELAIPKEKKVKVEKPFTPIEQLKAREDIVLNDQRKPEKIAPDDLAKARERGFITSVKEIVPELRIENQYIPRDTDVLAIKARNYVVDNFKQAEQIAMNPKNDAGVAITAEVIKYYAQQAEIAPNQAMADLAHQKIADISNAAAFNLTEGGRFIQAAAILARNTPEGQVRFAAREIQRYNEEVVKTKGGIGGLKKKIPELTGEQAAHILKEMKEIAQMPDGKSKYIRFGKVQDYVSELVPTPLYDKIITVWKAGLLTGIKTSGLNIYANVHHLEMEVAKNIPAAQVDKIVSYFTGERAVVPNVEGLAKGGIEGMGKMLDYIKTGYSERDIGTKLDYKKVNMGKGNLARALQAYTNTVFRVLGAEDQPFYYATKLMSLYEQAKVAAINQNLKGAKAQELIDQLVQNPTEKMIKYATKDAETAVFINQTTLGDIARGIQRLPGGEIIVPFGRTPSAVAMQIVNYSPVGIVKTIIENIGKGRFDQRLFSQGIGRGITGTAVLVMGAKLYQGGLITLDYPKDEKERKLWELEGRQANSIWINGKWRTVQTLGPAGNLLIIGGHFQRAFEESGSPTEAMGTALAGSAKSFTEQTFMRGVNQFADALSDPERSAPMVVGNTISSIIPTIVSDVARATDVTERRAETVPEKLMKKIPGARQTLEPQITVLGEEKQATANPLEIMIDPTRPSKEISTPVITELRRLWDEGWEVSPTLLGERKGYEPLTPQENTELWKRAGQITKEGLDKLIGNELYKDLPDEKKADIISKLIIESQTIAKTEMVAKKLSGLDDKELVKTLFELRKSGLATEDIIPIALSKRKPEAVRKIESRKED